MKFYKTLSVLLLATVLFSCIEHEVIPPPKEEVELNSSFSATLEGSQYELIQDVNGYYCDATQAKEILPTPQLSTVTYYSAMKSDAALDFIQIGIGKLNFNADASIDPSVEQFTTFFNSNTNPPYSFEAENGVEVIFRDGSGNVWRSYQDAGAPQDFAFTSLVQESDEEGDYMKFVANFSLELYDDIDNPTDTILMENAVFEGYFKK
tara:strand:- start:372 stop:992 length:621 start_codon:yes stop_codon:yes gene_type:complete